MDHVGQQVVVGGDGLQPTLGLPKESRGDLGHPVVPEEPHDASANGATLTGGHSKQCHSLPIHNHRPTVFGGGIGLSQCLLHVHALSLDLHLVRFSQTSGYQLSNVMGGGVSDVGVGHCCLRLEPCRFRRAVTSRLTRRMASVPAVLIEIRRSSERPRMGKTNWPVESRTFW